MSTRTNLKQTDDKPTMEYCDKTFVHPRTVLAFITTIDLSVESERYQRINIKEE